MRRLITFFLFLNLLTTVQAVPAFKKGTPYKLTCRQYGLNGGIVTGANHDSQCPLIYSTDNTLTDDAYWIIEATTNGHYTIQNAHTLQYITYNGIYDATHRYVGLTDEPDGSNSEWEFDSYNNYYIIRRADAPGEVFNVRSGSYMVGTYSSGGGYSYNEMFVICDADGNVVKEKETKTGIITDFITLRLNDKAPVYDKKNKLYMHTIPEDCMGGNDYIATLTYAPKEDGESYTLYIEDQLIENGTDHTFTEVEGGRTYTLVLKEEEEEISRSKLTFTSLPIVEINGYFSSTYSQGSIRVNQWFSTHEDTLYNAKLRWRGATAMGKPKKSYAVKIQDENLVSKDVSFLGLREDNNWILDAAAVDMSRMRNRVTTDLWNDFAAAPYYKPLEPKMVNGTRGQFVEVLLNGEYNGIYCMTEKIDRKQLKLKKYKATDTENGPVRGCLYKSTQWSYSVLMGHHMGSRYYPMSHPDAYKNTSMTWDSWEVKYPDLEDGEAIDWAPLYNAVDFVASATKNSFKTNVDKFFDMPLVRDYYLLIELILATDNHGKNMYWHCYNRNNKNTIGLGKEAVRLCLTPWDLDGTWGRRWDGSAYYTGAQQNFVDFLWNYEHGELTLYKRLKELDYHNWTDSLALRYALLRQGPFHEDSLAARFTRYKDLFAMSGAAQREINTWVKSDAGYLDFEEEDRFIRKWIQERLAYLDQQYDIENVLNSVKVENARSILSVIGGQGRILIETSQALHTTLYNTTGIAVRQLDIPAGITEVRDLTRGIYLIEGKKVIVK